MDTLLKVLEECWPRGIPLPDAKSKLLRVYLMVCGLAGAGLTNVGIIGMAYQSYGDVALLWGVLFAPILGFFGIYMGLVILTWSLPLLLLREAWRMLIGS